MSGSNSSSGGRAKIDGDSHAESAHPLGLTVHALPEPAMGEPRPPLLGARAKLALVLLICVAPVLASYFTYYVIRPEGRRNFGQLIDKPRPLPAITGRTLDGASLPLPSLKGQWLLVSVSSGACDAACEHHLYLQRQLLTGLGKERDRFDWLWLVSDEAPVRPALLPALKEATVLRVPADQLAQWLEPETGHQLPDHLYVVDPFGSWMMRFPAKLDNTGATSARRDLERLLRASSIWDKAGRTGGEP